MLYAINPSPFLCFALIHNVTLRVKGFRGKASTLRRPEGYVTQIALDWRHLIKLEMSFHLRILR